MRIRWSIFLLLFALESGMGWEIFLEYSHTMNALGKDNLFRLGVASPQKEGFFVDGYGEVNLFLGVPLQQKTNTLASTVVFPYTAVGLDLGYRNMTLAEMQPYARFGMYVVWPHQGMTSTGQGIGIRGGIGMLFLPWLHTGVSVGVDFTALMEQTRADKIVTSPWYHQGVQVTGGIWQRF